MPTRTIDGRASIGAMASGVPGLGQLSTELPLSVADMRAARPPAAGEAPPESSDGPKAGCAATAAAAGVACGTAAVCGLHSASCRQSKQNSRARADGALDTQMFSEDVLPQMQALFTC